MSKPNILVIAGHDPSGGAGIHADIEAIHSLGGFASTLITGLTVQNSRNVTGFELVDIDLLTRQAEALLDDMDFQAVKIGMTGSPVTIAFVAHVLDQLPDVPVVLDPVLAAEAGGALTQSGTGGDSVPVALMRELAPRSTLATPNLPEALELSGCTDLGSAGRTVTEAGCATLITGSHDNTPGVRNHLYTAAAERTWEWERLTGSFHGSGCTLASAIATRLGHGDDLEVAVERAQQYVQASLANAWQPGRGQLVPDRRHG